MQRLARNYVSYCLGLWFGELWLHDIGYLASVLTNYIQKRTSDTLAIQLIVVRLFNNPIFKPHLDRHMGDNLCGLSVIENTARLSGTGKEQT